MALQLPALRQDQMQIAMHPARIKTLAMGRRWGKTTTAGTVAVACANAGAQVAWVAPTYKNSRPLWRFCEAATAPEVKRLRMNRTEREIEFPLGGRIGVYTADNDVGMRGEAFDVVIVDEAAQMREETYTDVILPTLADRNGSCWLISTPKGRNWFYTEWQRGMQDGKEQASFRAPSSANPSPKIRHAADLARERVSDRSFRQEWLAEFVEDGAGVFRRVTEAATATPQAQAQDKHEYIFGVDWAKYSDYTVFAVIDVTLNELVHLDRFNQVDYSLQRGRLAALYERFRPHTIMAERNSIGDPAIEELARAGMPVQPFTTTNASKAQAIDGLSLAFEQQALRILPDAVLISELQSYEAERLPSGMLRYSAPAGMHDDTVMALAIAWHGAQTTGPAMQTENPFYA